NYIAKAYRRSALSAFADCRVKQPRSPSHAASEPPQPASRASRAGLLQIWGAVALSNALSVQAVGDAGYEQHDGKSGAASAQRLGSGLAWVPDWGTRLGSPVELSPGPVQRP